MLKNELENAKWYASATYIRSDDKLHAGWKFYAAFLL